MPSGPGLAGLQKTHTNLRERKSQLLAKSKAAKEASKKKLQRGHETEITSSINVLSHPTSPTSSSSVSSSILPSWGMTASPVLCFSVCSHTSLIKAAPLGIVAGKLTVGTLR